MSLPSPNIQPVHLSFADIYPLNACIAEIQVKKDIEICLHCVTELHDALRFHFDGDVGLLVNRINSYSYDSSAQFKITTLPQIKAIAVVHHSTTSWVTNRTMQELPPNRIRNMRNFWRHANALDWLHEELHITNAPEPGNLI